MSRSAHIKPASGSSTLMGSPVKGPGSNGKTVMPDYLLRTLSELPEAEGIFILEAYFRLLSLNSGCMSIQEALEATLSSLRRLLARGAIPSKIAGARFLSIQLSAST